MINKKAIILTGITALLIVGGISIYAIVEPKEEESPHMAQLKDLEFRSYEDASNNAKQILAQPLYTEMVPFETNPEQILAVSERHIDHLVGLVVEFNILTEPKGEQHRAMYAQHIPNGKNTVEDTLAESLTQFDTTIADVEFLSIDETVINNVTELYIEHPEIGADSTEGMWRLYRIFYSPDGKKGHEYSEVINTDINTSDWNIIE